MDQSVLAKCPALMNHVKENTNKSYIIVVPTVNIVLDFAGKCDSTETIKQCVDNGAFNNLKAAIDEKTAHYYSCSRCLGSIIEHKIIIHRLNQGRNVAVINNQYK